MFVTELAVPRLMGLVMRREPSGLYQKSYPGSDGVTLGESYNNSETKAGSEREWKGHTEKIPRSVFVMKV